MVPGLAGMAEVPYGQFLFYNAAGGLLWGTGFVLLGYFAGAAWKRVAADASWVGLILLILVFVGLIVARILRSIREHGERLPDRLARAAPVAWARARFPTRSAWLARRIDTRSPSGFGLSVVILAGAVCSWIFIGLTQDVFAHEEAVLSDPGFTRFVVDHRVAWATTFMRPLVNPASQSQASTYDGTPLRASFYFTSIYIDGDTLNQKAWRTAYADGHEPVDAPDREAAQQRADQVVHVAVDCPVTWGPWREPCAPRPWPSDAPRALWR